MKIFIDRRTRISYASYYIEGLYQIYGKSRVTFSGKYFKDLIQADGVDDFDHYFAFVIDDDSSIKRIVIDYRDKNTINKNALSWTDIYGKVNYNETIIIRSCDSPQIKKIVAIGPNFGVKIWNDYLTLYYLIVNYINTFNKLPVSLRTYIAGYNWQRKRPAYNYYSQSITDKYYIFFVSTLYNKEIHTQQTNKLRAAFIRACKAASSIKFEGGLLAKPNHTDFKIYEDVITSAYVQPAEYLIKIKKSVIVFNTPAVWGCHGWKLGEFLAMGKAIISTPLLNEMPYPFEHGKHVHFVNSEEEIKEAVEKIANDYSYRQQLENGARSYFTKYLSPEKIIQRLNH